MTRKQALAELIAKVEAGDECIHTFAKVYPVGTSRNNWLHNAYNGSLDAAKALHEAVLPGWFWVVDNDEAMLETGDIGKEWTYKYADATSDTTARAWLLAILKALHAQETDT